MVNQSIIEISSKYVDQIPKDIDVKKAYLFGSYAKGKETENSDIDIALIVGNMKNFFDTQKRLMRARRNIDLRIEPHPIGEKDFTTTNPLAFEIQNTGIEIKTNQRSKQQFQK